MCRHDVIAKQRHVTDDVSGSGGDDDVTAMANRRRKSPDPFCDDDDYDDVTSDVTGDVTGGGDGRAAAEGDEEASVRRRNAVLDDLLATRNLEELDEAARRRFRARTAALQDDDEVERLRLHHQRPQDVEMWSSSSAELDSLRGRLRQSEAVQEQLTRENVELRAELRDAELTMRELHDQFQTDDGVQLRELQRELDHTARDCRLLHFKVPHLY